MTKVEKGVKAKVLQQMLFIICIHLILSYLLRLGTYHSSYSRNANFWSISITSMLFFKLCCLSCLHFFGKKFPGEKFVSILNTLLIAVCWGQAYFLLTPHEYSEERRIIGAVVGIVIGLVPIFSPSRLERNLLFFVILGHIALGCIISGQPKYFLSGLIPGLISGFSLSAAFGYDHKFTTPVRLACMFIGVIFIMESMEAVEVLSQWSGLSIRVDQSRHWDLAGELVQEIQPIIKSNFDPSFVQSVFAKYSALNNKLNFYLSGEDGKLISAFVPNAFPVLGMEDHSSTLKKLVKRDVEVEIIKKALHLNDRYLTLCAREPFSESSRRLITFSAAPINIAGKSGYLFIVLQSKIYDQLLASAQLRTLIHTAIFACFSTLLLAVGLGSFVSRNLTGRIRNFIDVLGCFEKGDFSKRLPVNGNDEVTEFAVTVNNMADTIVAKNRELEELDQRRRELITGITTEVEEPMRKVYSLLNVLHDKINSPTKDKVTSLAEEALSAVSTQSQIVRDLFELSKLEGKNEPLQLDTFILQELIQDIVSQYANSALSRGVTYNTLLPFDPISIRADVALLSRALSAVLGHLNKLVTEKTNVTIEAIKSEVEIAIEIKQERLALSLEADKLDHNLYTKAAIGIPIDIARRILEMHNSKLIVMNVNEQGLIYRLCL